MLIAEARKDPAYARLRTIPFLGPVRVAQLLAVLQTPWRFRTKRSLWAYAGLAVVTHSSSDYEVENGRVVRRRRRPSTRGLNRNHNRVLKNVFKGAAQAAIGRPGALQDLYRAMSAYFRDTTLVSYELLLKSERAGERLLPCKPWETRSARPTDLSRFRSFTPR